MTSPSSSGSARNRKRRLDTVQVRAQSSSTIRSTAARQARNPPALSPQCSVRGSSPQREGEQHQRQQQSDDPPNRRAINPAVPTSAQNNDADDDPYGDGVSDLEAADVPSDSVATILLLQKEFYGAAEIAKGEGGSGSAGAGRGGGERTGVVLQHQIYTILENRTAVDLDLTTARRENTLRAFRLGTGREDWGLMSTEHYLRVICNVLSETHTRDGSSQGSESSKARGHAQPSVSDSTAGNSSSGDRRGRRGGHDNAGGGSGSGSGSGSARCSESPPAAPTWSAGSAKRSRPGISSSCSLSRSGSVGDIDRRTALSARDVLEHLVRSNTRAYASRQEVASAMRGLSSGVGCAGGREGHGDGARGRAEGGGDDRTGSLVGNGVGGGKDEEEGLEEEDLRSLKRKEEKVMSVTSELVRAGFLLPRRDVGREEAYWFTMPQLGKVTVAIARGRKAITAALRRTRYKEMKRSVLQKKNPARGSGLPFSFHVRDLLGLGVIRELDTPSGAFLRLARDA